MNQPQLTISKTHIGNFTQGQVGAQYTVNVGSNGPGNTAGTITVVDTPPAGLTITGMSGSNWACTVGTGTCTTNAVLTANGTLPLITVTVNVNANATSPQVNSVAVSGGGATGASTTDTTTIIQLPDIIATGTLTAFTTCAGAPSASQSFTVSGTALTANLVVTAPAGFEVSLSSGSGFGSNVSLTPASGTVVTTTIFARLSATATGTPSGNIACTSTGATTRNVTASGTAAPSPTTANAGPDQTLCATSATLAANTATVGTGAWSIISGTGGAVTTPSSPTSAFTGVAGTTYTLRWTISNAPCTASTDDVVITLTANPTTANAGPDQTLCATSATLAANTATTGTGAWSIISGTGGAVTTPSSPTSAFTGVAGTTYTLRWTISNAPCSSSTDDVVITLTANPTTANAGPDQTLCATSATLAANTATTGTGAWSIISGTGGAVTTPSSPTSAFTGLAGTTYTLRWTISNAPCTASTDDVVITLTANPTVSNAGPDQAVCTLVATLAGNTPSVGTGAWTQVSGPGTVTFGTASSPTSTATASVGGAYTLRWTISNAPCTASTDDVIITYNTPPTVGTYANTAIAPGGSATVTPNAAPADNGSIASVTGVAAPNTFTGTLTGNLATGAVMISNAGPAGVYTLTVTVTDNCSATVQRTFIAVVSNDTMQDTDNDGIPDLVEITEGTNPLVKDNYIFADTPMGRRLFVMQQYRDFLVREGDPAGITHWVNLLTAGTYTRAQVIEAFYFSPEFNIAMPSIARLYFAAFNRIPDYRGLTDWSNSYRGGMALNSIAQTFLTSAEFIQTYGTLDNTQFVTLLYNHALNRAPDPGGLSAWVGALNANTLTRAEVLTGFSESAECMQSCRHKVFVAIIYVDMLQRAPLQAEFDNAVTLLNGGTPRTIILQTLLDLPEYSLRFLP